MTLQHYLQEKPLFYQEIDTARMPRVYQKIKSFLDIPKIIHIVGTNGKGTTGRFLAAALYAQGAKVGHYTSPHILDFNERIWLNGTSVSDTHLQEVHQQLQELLSKEDALSLSYFEYTTFLAMLVYRGCDYLVLEAGLGGEYDATSVFENILTLVTPIDIDHQSFLGESIDEIATTKLNAIQKNCILAEQKFGEVYEIAKTITKQKGATCLRASQIIKDTDLALIQEIARDLELPGYMIENLKVSVSALKFLDLPFSLKDFAQARLFGRMSFIAENIIVDVGHNPLAAHSIVQTLGGQKYTLIYNTYKDKEYKTILTLLKPIINDVEILELKDPRIVLNKDLEICLSELKIKYKYFDPQRFEQESQQKSKKYLVFGSFSVVEKFLKAGFHS